MKLKYNYWAPTPRKFRALGDAILAVGTTITGSAIASDNDVLAYWALAITCIGKFLTNFFAEGDNNETQE